LVTLPKKFWTRVLGSVVIRLYADECTLSVDRVLAWKRRENAFINFIPMAQSFCIRASLHKNVFVLILLKD